MSIYIDTLSQHSMRTLPELAGDLFANKNEIPYFRYQIGRHMPAWRKAKVNDEVTYCIDNLTLFRGNIKFIKTMAFRPKWLPDNELFKMFVDFARSQSNERFSRTWHLAMSRQHSKTIIKTPQRWSFAVFVTIIPTTFYQENLFTLMDRVDTYKELHAVTDSNVTQVSALND